MMKRLKLAQAMYVLLLVSIFSIGICSILIVKSKVGTAIFVISDKIYSDIYTTNKKYEYYSDYISVHQCIPQIKGLEDKHFQKNLNKSIYKSSLQSSRDIIESSRTYNKNLIQDKLSPIKFEYTENFSVIPSIKPYYNVALFKYKYSGGAHGENNIHYIVLNTETSSVVTLEDLFKPNIDYLNLLNNELNTQLVSLQNKTQLPLYKDPNKIKITDEQNFYMDIKGNIVIVFNVYEIAPYASGIIEVSIPTDNISMYMK